MQEVEPDCQGLFQHVVLMHKLNYCDVVTCCIYQMYSHSKLIYLCSPRKPTLSATCLCKMLEYALERFVSVVVSTAMNTFSPHTCLHCIQLYSRFTAPSSATSLGGSRHSSMALAAAGFADLSSREMCT